MSLYNRYRPQGFEEVMGNEDVIRSLQTILKRDRKLVPHALLFTGPSGCGKTTLARIFAQELGCGAMDLSEMDSAHFRGIDTIREIRQQMVMKPVSGKCRVYILDEVHGLSKDAQSALLKALEDTPAHVYFALATTDPGKLLPTLLNRCSRFDVRSLSERELIGLMSEIAEAEKKKVPPDVLQSIAETALGSARAALVVLDGVIDLDPKEMKTTALHVAQKENRVIELLRLLMDSRTPWTKVAAVLRDIDDEPERVRQAALGYATAILLKSDNGRAFVMLDAFSQPNFYNGKPGLVHQCYMCMKG